MIPLDRFALNRIACPSLGLADFFKLARELGLNKVELRNDLADARVTDSLAPAAAARVAADVGVEVLTINALQKFNVKALAAPVAENLKGLIEAAAGLKCPAIVFCPNNDTADRRDAATKRAETVAALAALGPLLAAAGVVGYVEPLGFAESSLSSVVVAQACVRESGQGCYRILFDTFHHFLGPDQVEDIGTRYAVRNTALIHASGVEAAVPRDQTRDQHRVLVGEADRTGCREHVRVHVQFGYAGPISLEPFSPAVQKLGRAEVAGALKRTLQYLGA
jgi:2-keto-myo-inositol isomerase